MATHSNLLRNGGGAGRFGLVRAFGTLLLVASLSSGCGSGESPSADAARDATPHPAMAFWGASSEVTGQTYIDLTSPGQWIVYAPARSDDGMLPDGEPDGAGPCYVRQIQTLEHVEADSWRVSMDTGATFEVELVVDGDTLTQSVARAAPNPPATMSWSRESDLELPKSRLCGERSVDG